MPNWQGGSDLQAFLIVFVVVICVRTSPTGVSASGMALDSLAHVPGYLVSLACMATLVLTPRVQGFDARTGCSLSLTGSALLSRPCQGEQNMASEGPTTGR